MNYSVNIYAQSLKAGAYKTNITPKLGTVINGNFLPKYTKTIHDSLYAKALAFTNGKNRFVFVIVDCTGMEQDFINETKQKIRKRTGLLESEIMISATHAHSCGSLVSVLLCQADIDYLPIVSDKIVEAVSQALKRAKPAQIAWGSINATRPVSNRRWFMKEGFKMPNPLGGTDKVRMNPELGSPYLLKPAGPVDPEVGYLAVKTLTGKWISLLSNYSLHYVGDFPDNEGIISADYFGEIGSQLQQKLKADTDFVGIMSNGTSGDINSMDFEKNKNYSTEPFAKTKEIATEITDKIIAQIPNLKWEKNAILKSRFARIPVNVRQLPKEQYADCLKTFNEADYLNIKEIDWATKEMFQIYSYEQVMMADMPTQVSMPIAAVNIGSGIIGTLPAEIFAETGLRLKASSPTDNYFTIGLANDADTYVPPKAHFELGGYETWRCRGSYMEIDAEEKFVNTMKKLIIELKMGR